MTKKILSILVSLALMMTLVPTIAMAGALPPGGGTQTYPGPYYSITTNWTAGGTVVFVDEENIFPENHQPNSGDCFHFQAVPDSGYRFTGWSYYQELYSDMHGLIPVRDRVYRTDGDKIEVHINPLFYKIQTVIYHWFTGGLGWQTQEIYNYSLQNISDTDYWDIQDVNIDNPFNPFDSFEVDTFSNSVRHKCVTANFEAIEYTIVFHEDGGNTSYGVLYGDGTVTLADLHTGSDTTTAFFTGWSLTSSGPLVDEVTLDGTGAVTTIDVYANYLLRQQYTVSATTDGAGSLGDSSDITFLEGNSVSEADVNTHFAPVADPDVAASGTTPGEDNEFVGWFVGSDPAVFPLTATTALIAKFSTTILPPEQVAVTAVADGPGSVTGGTLLVDYNTTVTEGQLNTAFSPTEDADTPTEDNYFVGWFDKNGDPFDFSAPLTESTQVTAKFATESIQPETVTITATTNGPGTLGNSTPLSIPYNTSVTQTQLDTHFQPVENPPDGTGMPLWIGWYDTEGNLFDLNTVLTEDITLVATFIYEPQYIVTALAGPNGSVADPTTVILPSITQYDLDDLFTPVPDTGYKFKEWTYQDGTLIPDGIITTSEDETIVVATFEEEQSEPEMITISATAGTGGSVAPASAQSEAGVQVDLDSLFTPTPDSGYDFAGWTDDQGNAIPDGLVTPQGDISVIAIFEEEQQTEPEPEMVTITAVAGLGGSVAPASVQVEKGSAVDLDTLFTPTPDTGNSFAKWVDASNADIVDGLMTANDDVTVTALFSTTIDDGETPGGEVDDGDDSDNPHTGNQSMLWIAFILFALAGAGAVYMSRIREARRMRR